MQKKVLSIILAISIVACLFSGLNFSVSASTEGDFEYEVVNGNEITITGYLGTGGDVYIPKTLATKPVTKIGNSAFSDNQTISYVWFSDNVVTINSGAFENCQSITAVDFGGGLKTIGKSAFKDCASLKEVNLPDSLEILENPYWNDEGAFHNCTSLKKVTIGNGLKIIPKNTFDNCSALESITFGSAIEEIHEYAFENCKSLKTAYFLGNSPTITKSKNEALTSAKWIYLPNNKSFKQGSPATKTYLVTFKGNGGTFKLSDDSTPSDINKTVLNENISAPLIPEREGYTFAGWYDNQSLQGDDINFSSYTIKSNATFYAKWEVNTYRVFYVPCGGEITTGGKYVNYGEKIGELPVPQIAGNTFEGWYPGMNSSGKKYTADSIMPAKDVIMYAGWSVPVNKFNVIFDTNGGNFIAPINVQANKTVSQPANPYREGYIFAGWYSNADCTERFLFNDTLIVANTTIYAEWYPVIYTITYKLNGGTDNYLNPGKFAASHSTIILKPAIRKGYTFAGWYSDANLKNVVKTIPKGTLANQVLYAKWSINTYSITYKLDGGVNGSNPKTYTVTSAEITLKSPTKKGYTFGGWYSDSKYKTKVTKIAKGSTGNKTLYAKWIKNTYKITYCLNSGTNNKSNPKSYTVTSSSITLKKPTRKGYTFVGWYSDSKYKTKVTKIAKGSTGNKTLYAKWTKNTYKITYKLNKGKNNKNNKNTYTVTTATFKLQKPTRKGYTFVGWYSDAKYKRKVTKIAKGSTGNITLYAKWKKK